jgi:hypothetical protein
MADIDPLFDFIDWFKQGQKWTNSDGSLTEEAINQLENITNSIQQTTTVLGGGDIIQNITNSETYETSVSDSSVKLEIDAAQLVEEMISQPPTKEWHAELANADYTAVDHELVEGQRQVTITLDANAAHNDQIITGNGDGTRIRISGGDIELRYAGNRGKQLDILDEGTFIHWYKFITEDQEYWRGA